MKFTHLHVHSEYSLLDGSARIKDIVSRAKDFGMDSVALTDHGVMFGVVDFYKAATGAGIKPIIGCELYVATGSRFNKENTKDNSYYHLVLLAENDTGYHNLVKLSSYGFTEGYYYKPRIDFELLKQHREGLIALSACLSGPVSKNILEVSYAHAKEMALMIDGIMGRGNFYMELQDHGMMDQKTVNSQLIRISGETGIPLICTNDTHYINEDDAQAHDILLCIQTGKTIKDEERMRYTGNQFYFKSPEQMSELFSHVPEALSNTQVIAERCNVNFEFNKYKLPHFILPEEAGDMSHFDYLRKLSYEGLRERYGDSAEACPNYAERMEYELQMIREMGFVDYFLIVWDFIRYARENGIFVGPGRGSSAGSLVVYCLRITNVEPFKYNLHFERFLNPERISMPDIDIDFCYERRQEVIDYVIGKYGEDHVAQIITFGTMGAKAVVRDVGRALAMPYADADRIAKMIPFGIGITLEKSLELSTELKQAYDFEDETKYLIDMAMRLEGLPRHASTHAAGVVISDKPIIEHVPLNVNDGVITTQFSMTLVEELGLLKMDFLGLRTLTVIQSSVSEINRLRGFNLDMDLIDYDDKEVFELISQAKTEGVFQLESDGMKNFMKELQPSSLDEILAGISLFRPGPMDSIPRFIHGKRVPSDIRYTHQSLEPILKATNGCIVYQEQVMQIVRDLAGYSLGRSDLLRRAMSKKKASVMAEERHNFIHGIDDIPGCVKNGIPAEVAERIFEEMSDFAKYAFPKPHAAAYAILAYQTAWLKVHYPVEFMAALMTSVMDFTSKVAEYINECKKINIKVLPPDINEGYAPFSVSGGSIRFGLLAIKNVGRNVVAAIVSEREKNGAFKSMTDFINRMEAGDLNTRCMESLIKAGVFDSLGGKRAQYMFAYKNILSGITANKRRNIEGQLSLFDDDFNTEGSSGSFESRDNLPDIQEYRLREMLDYEKDVLGIYISGHPLNEYMAFICKNVDTYSYDLANKESKDAEGGMAIQSAIIDGQNVNVGGIIVKRTVKYTKNNKAMAFLTVEDLYGAFEVIVFPQIYEENIQKTEKDAIIVVNGKASVREDEDTKVLCNSITVYQENNPQKTLWVKIGGNSKYTIDDIRKLCGRYKGTMPTIVYDEANKKKIPLEQTYNTNMDDILVNNLKSMFGEDAVVIR